MNANSKDVFDAAVDILQNEHDKSMKYLLFRMGRMPLDPTIPDAVKAKVDALLSDNTNPENKNI